MRQDGPVRVGERRLPASVGDADAIDVRKVAKLLVEPSRELPRRPRPRVDGRRQERRVVGADEPLRLALGDPRQRRVRIDARAGGVDDLDRLGQRAHEVDRLGDRLLGLAGQAEDEPEVGRDAVLGEQRDQVVEMAPANSFCAVASNESAALSTVIDTWPFGLADEVRELGGTASG